MSVSAGYFHGEGLVFSHLATVGLLTLGLIGLAHWFVRKARRRMGNTAYWFAPLPFVLILVVVLLHSRATAQNEGAPTILPSSELAALIKALPDYAPFGYSGLAFYRGKLYVGTNLGLLEIQEGRVVRIFRVQGNYSVVSGPWLDRADQLLWMMDDQTNQSLSFDGTVWHRMDLPKPPKGSYSRGDVLEGVKPTSNAKGFWVEAGATVWRWDSTKNGWVLENLPPSHRGPKDEDVVIAVLPIGSKLLFIVRHESLSFLTKEGQDFSSDTIVTGDGDWRSVPSAAGLKFFAKDWVVTDDSGYVCTRNYVVLKITTLAITKLETPGKCETLATTESGTLLAGFQGKGVYGYTSGWHLLAAYPYPSGEANTGLG